MALTFVPDGVFVVEVCHSTGDLELSFARTEEEVYGQTSRFFLQNH